MIVERIRQFLERHHIGPARIVVACSGGADSTALLVALAEMRSQSGADLLCAHVNHHLRGEESDADQSFVGALAGKLSIPLWVGDGTLRPEAIQRSGLEGAAREVRMARLQEARRGEGYVATAHQRDDQAETVVMRLLTGTGLAGLRGIHEVREDGFIRPLIDVTRRQIDLYLAERSITPRVDRTNADPRFLRNRVRAALRQLSDSEIEAMAQVARQAQQLWPHVQRAIDAVERQHLEVRPSETLFHSLPEDAWMRQALLLRHIRRLDSGSRDISARDLERLARFEGPRVTVTRSLERITRGGSHILRRIPAACPSFERTVPAGETVMIPEIGAAIRISPAGVLRGERPAFLVRNRRPGDRFGHKKLKEFLIDRKIPAEIRDSLPLVVWNGAIVWVGGACISDRFKVARPEDAWFEVMLEHESREEDQDRVQR